MSSVLDDIRQEGREEGERLGLRKGKRAGRQEGLQEGLQEGRQKGLIEKAKSVALLMLQAGKYDIEDIVNISGLTFEEVKALQVSLAH